MKDDDIDIEFEFARMRRLKRKKEKAIHVPVEEVKETPPTYRALQRIRLNGEWHVKVTRSDGMELTITENRYRRILEKGLLQGEPLPKEMPLPLKKITSPKGFFGIQCGDDRVQIIYSLNKEWKDLMCYHHRLQRTMHLKREDLYPKRYVDAACEFLQHLDKIHP